MVIKSKKNASKMVVLISVNFKYKVTVTMVR